MVTLNIVQNGSSVCAVYDLTDHEENIDEISLSMINNNQTTLIGLAPIRVEASNGVNSKMSFDITGRITLKEYISHMLSQWQFRDIMLNLINAIQNLDEYMIDVNQVLLDYNNVYINQLDLSVSFICIALCGFNSENSLASFFRSVVERSNVVASANEKDYFHCAWNVIRNENGFSLDNLKKALISGSTVAMPAQGVSIQKQPVASSVSIEKNVKVDMPSQSGVNTAQTSSNVLPQQPQVPMQPMQQAVHDKMDNSSLVTVAPTPKPVAQPVMSQNPGVDNNANQKKSGFLGKLFGKKTDNASPAKPSNIKPSNARPSNGGISKFKNGGSSPVHAANNNINNNNNLGNENVPANVNNNFNPNGGTPIGSQQHMPIPNNQTPPMPEMQKENVFSGTTVLSSMGFQGGMVNSAPPMPNVQPNNGPGLGLTLEKKTIAPPPAVENNMFPPQPQAPVTSYNNEMNVPAPQAAPQTPDTSGYGETTVLDLGMSGETTVLSAADLEPVLTAYLVRLKNNERVPITGTEFVVGKERNSVDYFISDNTAVSRNHASIISNNNRFFVVDHDSTNHTYVNGKVIPTNSEIELLDGMKVRFGNEEFEFKLM